MKIACIDCGAVDVEGEMFTPYQLPDLPDDTPILVCEKCKELPEHQSRVEQTHINLQAEESYQEFWNNELNNE